MPLIGRALAEQLELRRAWTLRGVSFMTAVPVVLGMLFVVQADTGLFQDSKGKLLGLIPAKADPTVDTIRWAQVASEMRKRGLLDDKDAFLFTDCWQFSSELALATDRALPVACYHRDSRSYTFWSQPQDWVGHDGIYVSMDDSLIAVKHYAPWFKSVTLIDEFPIVRAGVPLQTVRLYRCSDQVSPFLFGYNGKGAIPHPGPELDREIKLLGQRGDAHVFR